jgi:hypothetical protein
MLREERDETKGRLLYLEHSLSEKEREHQVCLQELNKERRERVEAQQALEKYRRRSDEEIDLLRTQLQFNVCVWVFREFKFSINLMI